MSSSRLVASFAALVFAGTALAAIPATSASAAPGRTAASARQAATSVSTSVSASKSASAAARVAKRKKPTYGHYNPVPGLRLNNPRGPRKAKRHIINYLISTIYSTPPGATIKAESWSLRSPGIVSALLNAHNRGVGVQVLIDRGTTKPRNPDFRRLRIGLTSHHNAKRPYALRSWARACVRSCRGKYGIAHTKLYLFSRTGKAKYVTMYGSANLTDLAASIQWNDLYTVVNNKPIYSFAGAVFAQASHDRPLSNPVVYKRFGSLTMAFMPWYGRHATSDPAMAALAPIRCTGAAPGYGNGGRTVVRVAQTAFLDARGIALARRLHQLRTAGCDVKVIYAIMGGTAFKALKYRGGRGAVPMRQLAIDRNHDHLYDRYLHLKVLTVQGVYGSNRRAAIAWNGSSNWSQASLASDDMFVRLVSGRVARSYRSFVDHWFKLGPGQRGMAPVARPLPPGANPRKMLQVD